MRIIAHYDSSPEELEAAHDYRLSNGREGPIVIKVRNCPGCNGITGIRTGNDIFASFTRHHLTCPRY